MQHPNEQLPSQAQEPPDQDVALFDLDDDEALAPLPAPCAIATDPEDDPEEIFRRAISEMKTQPLPGKKEEEALLHRRLVICALILFGSFLAGSIIGILTYPTVTITLVPIERDLTLTVPITLPMRALAPVTLTQSLSTLTTGRGHQDAHAATGTLTFYNGEFTAQTIAAGTVFTGSEGVQVAMDETVTVPAANPPYLGQTSVLASAVVAGASGNIPALEINMRCCFPDMAVKNTAPFAGGSDARDFRAVDKADLSSLAARLKQILALQLPQAFALRPGEAAQPTRCDYRFSADRLVGEEAQTVTVKGVGTCQGLAYTVAAASRAAITAFTRRANPGQHFALMGTVKTTVVSVSPFLVRCHGTWVYELSGDEERLIAAHIAGDSQQQATTYLLQTGFVRHAVVPENVPKDPDHIHFRVVVESPG